MILITLLLLIVGIFVLVRGADVLVDGSQSLAKRVGVSDIFIGLTVVAFGTSLPELFVSLQSSLSGNAELAIASVLGSNIFNILVVISLCALIAPLTIKKQLVWREIPIGLLAVLLLFTMGNDKALDGAVSSTISSSEGLTLLVFFALYIGYMFVQSLKLEVPTSVITKKYSMQKSIAYILLGLIALILGGKIVTESAITLGGLLGISQGLIGLSIVAIGSSLPELVTAVVAMRKGNPDIAIGNVVGSNIFNILFVLGITAFIQPLSVNEFASIDMFVVALASFILFAIMFVGIRRTIEKSQAILMLGIYLVYMLYISGR